MQDTEVEIDRAGAGGVGVPGCEVFVHYQSAIGGFPKDYSRYVGNFGETRNKVCRK